MLGGVEGAHVDLSEGDSWPREQGARSRGEVLQARADADHQIGPRRCRVGGAGSRDADPAERQRVVPRQRPAPSLRLGHWSTHHLGQTCELRLRACVDHASAGDDQRGAGFAQTDGQVVNLTRIRRRPADAPEAALEKTLRIVVRLGLNVLAKRERRRSAQGRVEHSRQRPGQSVDQLLRSLDAVEIAGDGPETVVGRDGRVGEVLDLLQHRIRTSAGKDVTGQE